MPESPQQPGDQAKGELAGYEVLVAVTGGIAAYKVGTVVSRLVQAGCGVTVAMTRSARRFVGVTTFQALTGRKVYTSLWQAEGHYDPQHISLTERADLVLIAPATANIIGKIASGIADDLVSTLVVAASCPVMLAPAMNARMWANPIVQENVQKLKKFGYIFLEPGVGWLACGVVGPGRMAEPEVILQHVREFLLKRKPKGLGCGPEGS